MIYLVLLLWFALSIPAALLLGSVIAVAARNTDRPMPVPRTDMARPRICS